MTGKLKAFGIFISSIVLVGFIALIYQIMLLLLIQYFKVSLKACLLAAISYWF